jgi:hypothetical protein
MNGSPLAGEKRGTAAPRRVIHCQVTESQFETLEDMAMMSGMKISEYIRHSLFGAPGTSHRTRRKGLSKPDGGGKPAKP